MMYQRRQQWEWEWLIVGAVLFVLTAVLLGCAQLPIARAIESRPWPSSPSRHVTVLA